MVGTRTKAVLRCPSCGFSLSTTEQDGGVCNECGRVFDIQDLLSRRDDLDKKATADLRAILAERLGGVLGALMITGGVGLICFSEVGPAQLLSGWGVTASVLTIAAVARQLIYGEPIYPVLLGFGSVWLVMGFLLWGYL